MDLWRRRTCLYLAAESVVLFQCVSHSFCVCVLCAERVSELPAHILLQVIRIYFILVRV